MIPHAGLLSLLIYLSVAIIYCSHELAILIDEFNYRAWHFITSFIDYAIQIYVGQKAGENQWRVMVLEVSSHCITISSDQYQKYKCCGCT